MENQSRKRKAETGKFFNHERHETWPQKNAKNSKAELNHGWTRIFDLMGLLRFDGHGKGGATSTVK